MTTQITPNLFLSSTKSSSTSSSSKTDVPTTVFFISGNPGLISYYHDFLSLVSEKLAAEDAQENDDLSSGFRIYGASLGGFDVGDKKEEDKKGKKGNNDPSTLIPGRLYSLEEQIDFVEKKLHALMRDSASSEPEPMNPRRATRSTTAAIQKSNKQKVILIGHSVGAYIAMEILRRHREEEKMGDGEAAEEEGPFDIVGAVLLFPTVIDIAKSAAGKRLTWLLYFIPQLALVASLVVKVLAFVFPDWVLRSLVRLVMGNPPSSAVESTLSFLKSERGVRQALHMAADEMRTITSDKWSDDIWGTSRAGKPPSRLVFYFGRNDHWVAERTRDEIIESRGGSSSKDGPTMIVCEDSIPHAFCIRHSPIMARKVARFIKDIVLE
ncbi:hypothetical protein DTO166G4_6295 [Paecilomyces variotii]|uniref:Lipid droplet-associated hydrolase n=1 Tax=Byssochlamys spectabilis TaxID=264951 RepID=A0A443HWG6_BYSSP|nr:hypothetical protein C8Q69DRAFT_464225 [Paecilomyces variotii]KAJ9195938.1 hypothetical protein DTO032I3_6645 [Paecilomyces variotii]KAJ9212139.1 hypothetical protein DTO166G4_6295 [Paecilomyces variotii]KAJ9239956.1 hypothetical protein DTO166G5_2223 [Paecilomyces variotii]KAJ9279697.1 hypothetical protein DTO021D3_3488 [Paecilomyces variotii]KAJ9347134.1 hypothetical protein DTO027B6_8 [Paecilomyces variotii]